jgi:hypothetical protein
MVSEKLLVVERDMASRVSMQQPRRRCLWRNHRFGSRRSLSVAGASVLATRS